MHANESIRIAKDGCDEIDGNGRCIRREDAIRPDDILKLGKQPALDVRVLDDGFDDQAGVCKALKLISRRILCLTDAIALAAAPVSTS
jgi:hypothetical protein